MPVSAAETSSMNFRSSSDRLFTSRTDSPGVSCWSVFTVRMFAVNAGSGSGAFNIATKAADALS